jgi:hypothetical protein
MQKLNFIIKLTLSILLINSSCTKKNNPAFVTEKRSFYMGTTPWPADLTVSEVDKTYQFINDHCDIVSHHFDEGVPYEEAYNNTTMPASLLQNVASRKLKTAASKKIFLSVAALSINRVSKAPYYSNAATDTTIKNYWKQLPFNNTKVITAYVNYISWLIQQFNPVYVNYGVESNGPLWNATDFALYKIFLSQVYPLLKTKYPNINFFISFIVDEGNEAYNYASQLIAYTDFIGLSAYPYIGISSSANGNTNPQNFPADYFEKFINLSVNKPLAFAETGYTAQNLSIPAYNLNKQGNTTWQKDYLELVLKLCDTKRAKLFIWFCPKDYDALITTFQNQGGATAEILNLLALWKDTGLIDENGIERPAYTSWLFWMMKEKVE